MIAYTKDNPVCSQNKLTNSRAEVLCTTQAFEKTIHQKLRSQQRDFLFKFLWNWVKFQQIACIKFFSPQIHRGELFSLKKKKRKQVLTKKKKNPKQFFFASLWRIIFFSPPHTSKKKKLSTITKIPQRKKKLAYLQTLMQMNLFGAHQEIIFLFLIPCWKSWDFFVANKKKIIISEEKI